MTFVPVTAWSEILKDLKAEKFAEVTLEDFKLGWGTLSDVYSFTTWKEAALSGSYTNANESI